MPERVLLTSVGWKPHLITDVAERLVVDRVVLIHTTHPKTLAVCKKLEKWSTDTTFIAVEDNFNFVEWHHAIQSAIADERRRNKSVEITVNLTAGHAITIANLGILAEQFALPCVCWDDDKKVLHHMVPSTLSALPKLTVLERQVLSELGHGPKIVSDLVDTTNAPQSSVSMALRRLRETGFAQVEQSGRKRIYSLRPGVELVA